MGLAIVIGTNPKDKDQDKDGIFDKLDVCPNTPLNVRVDEMGCPLDNDGDGVADYLDECPYTPSAAYGLIDSVGCPLDTDGDGVGEVPAKYDTKEVGELDQTAIYNQRWIRWSIDWLNILFEF